MSLEFIISDAVAQNEVYRAFFKLFQGDNLEKFFEDYAKDITEDDNPIFDIYILSSYLHDFIIVTFSSIINDYLDKDEYPPRIGELAEMIGEWHLRINRNCDKLVNKLSHDEEKKEQLTKKIEEILHITKKIDKQTEHPRIRPDYIDELVKKGHIETDGITAIASLDEIEEFLYTFGLETFNFKTLLQFRQRNGQPFSENSAKEAVKRARP